ncbi:MAG: hypothetical protein ACD_49C00070G0005 [uncultured bacterium (gcode 4)]|uniref:Cell division protein FtsL n=1 Tax=uncultured bacterium (gcode 4) TaxID=1234023 RepID=K2AW98_9BACT|nr:MAG: hypothetical protein ACD_49C00070G0005 [uncultured bacterium (gcode 4)]
MNPNIIVMKRWKIPFFSERKTSRENYKMSFTNTYILTILMIWFLWIYYVWSLNVNATKWYRIRNLELERRTLMFEQNLLNMKIAEVESLNSISEENTTNIMESIENPNYLVLKDMNMAFITKD